VDPELPCQLKRPNPPRLPRSREPRPPSLRTMPPSKRSRTRGVSSCPREKRLSVSPHQLEIIDGIVELVLGLLTGMFHAMSLADYRYGGIRSKHPTLAARAAMEAARRVSAIHPEDEDEYEEEQEDEQKPNFAERFLLGRFLAIVTMTKC